MATDADLRAAAELLRQNGYEARHPEVVTTPGEQAAIDSERKLRSGGAATPGEEPTADPSDIARYHEARANGTPHEQAQTAYLQGLFTGAVKGDERCVYDADRYRLEAGGYRDIHGYARTR